MQAIEMAFIRRAIVKDRFPVATPVGPALFSRLIFRNASQGLLTFVEGAIVVTTESGGSPPSVFLADGAQPNDAITDPFGGGAVNDPRSAPLNVYVGPLGLYVPSGDIYLNSIDAAAGEVIAIRVQVALYKPCEVEIPKRGEPGYDFVEEGYSHFPADFPIREPADQAEWDRQGETERVDIQQ